MELTKVNQNLCIAIAAFVSRRPRFFNFKFAGHAASIAVLAALASVAPSTLLADAPPVYVSQWSASGSQGVAVDVSGMVYVADFANNRIQKFSNNGSLVKQWGSFGTGNGQFESPTGVAADISGNI